ncbi:cobalamin biosynthesis protein CbiX, partial [Micromonospora sp. DH15]|nr:cobalamin biosynthesis protein CbiX [Micromonospora sp. DH15]
MRAAPLTVSGPRVRSVAAGDPVVLVAHGSRDPRAAEATRALARAVAAVRPGVAVSARWLDAADPGPPEVRRARAA